MDNEAIVIYRRSWIVSLSISFLVIFGSILLVSGMSFDSADVVVLKPKRGWSFFSAVVLGNLSAMLMCLTGIITLGAGSILGGIFIAANLGASLAIARSVLGEENWLGPVGIHAAFEVMAAIIAVAAGVFPLIATILSRLPLRQWLGFYIRSIAATIKPLAIVVALVILGASIETFIVKA